MTTPREPDDDDARQLAELEDAQLLLQFADELATDPSGRRQPRPGWNR